MGEDFIERRRRQFKRCVDEAFEAELCDADLFSAIAPESSEEIIGILIGEAGIGDELFPGPLDSSGNLLLFKGFNPVVRLSGEPAKIIGAVEFCQKAIGVRVTAIEAEASVVSVVVLSRRAAPAATGERG